MPQDDNQDKIIEYAIEWTIDGIDHGIDDFQLIPIRAIESRFSVFTG
jgi:hypothetical protein